MISRISVKADISQITRKLSALEKEQVPYATAVALTRTAKFTQAALVKQMSSDFNEPTSYTLNALRIEPATKTKLHALILAKDKVSTGNPASAYLAPEVFGGLRRVKAFENSFIRAGLMPATYYAIPTRAAPLDSHGNVPLSVISRIISQARGSAYKGGGRKIRGASTKYEYFSVGTNEVGPLKPGIYRQLSSGKGANVQPIFIFTTKRPAYRRRFRFYETATQVAGERFPIELNISMRQAIATAK
jgi:hypothetical protein